MNVRDFGATGDGQTDDTQAFLACVASVRAKVHALPGLTLHGGGPIDVPGGVYRLSGEIGLQNRERLRLDPDAFLVFDAGGLALDSFWINSHAEVEVTGGSVYSTHGGIGFHARGGAYSLISGTTWTGWDEAWRFVGSNGLCVRDAIVSAWANVGTQDGVGVHLMPAPVGGGSCNGNVVEHVQFNGRSIGIWSEDGSGNVVRSCNFNSNVEVLRCEGAQNLVVENCQAEGVRGNAYFRFGTPGGYASGRRVAQSIAIRNFVPSWNEPQAPALVLMERNAIVGSLELSTKAFVDQWAANQKPMICGGQPVWQAGMPEEDGFRYLLIEHLYRSGCMVGGSPLPPITTPVPNRLVDRPLYGIDHGA